MVYYCGSECQKADWQGLGGGGALTMGGDIRYSINPTGIERGKKKREDRAQGDLPDVKAIQEMKYNCIFKGP